MALSIRLATRADVPRLEPIVQAAIDDLQRPWLSPAQIAASHAIMGVDLQLVDDGTYDVVHVDDVLAGCGGWSRRATLYGGSHSPGRDAALLDPATQPARIRAMYTHPAHVRRGVGLLVLRTCEQAAAAEGFRTLELMATLSGRPLYERFGFAPVEAVLDSTGGVPVPLLRMRKAVASEADDGP